MAKAALRLSEKLFDVDDVFSKIHRDNHFWSLAIILADVVARLSRPFMLISVQFRSHHLRFLN